MRCSAFTKPSGQFSILSTVLKCLQTIALEQHVLITTLWLFFLIHLLTHQIAAKAHVKSKIMPVVQDRTAAGTRIMKRRMQQTATAARAVASQLQRAERAVKRKLTGKSADRQTSNEAGADSSVSSVSCPCLIRLCS